MLKELKQAFLQTSGRLRLLESVAGSQWRRRRLLILCYHSVAVDQEHLWRRSLFFTRAEFEARLDVLTRARANVLPLAEALERLDRGTLPPRAAVLTFDDGTADFSEIVWPLLRARGYPATVYVTTYYAQKRLPVFPLMCDYLLWKGRDRRLEAVPDLGVEKASGLATARERAAAARAIVAHADRSGLSAEERDRRAAALASRLGIDYRALLNRRVLQLMTPEETRAVAADGADVQLHTHRHASPRDRGAFERELRENRERIEAMTGRAASHFCYPSGVLFPEYLPWLEAEGVRSATTCRPGLVTRKTHPLLLPRIVDTAALSAVELEGWVSGISSFLPRRRGGALRPAVAAP